MYKGNPTYKPKFHPEDLLSRMYQGELDVEIYAAWKISKKTFYKWLQDHEDFKEAYEQGLPACEAWWVKEMKNKWQNGDDKGFKYCALIVNTKFNYRENQQQGSVTNNTINVQGNMNIIQDKSRPELLEFIKNKLEDNDIIDAQFESLKVENGSQQKE